MRDISTRRWVVNRENCAVLAVYPLTVEVGLRTQQVRIIQFHGKYSAIHFFSNIE
jgi:hypothetical protein